MYAEMQTAANKYSCQAHKVGLIYLKAGISSLEETKLEITTWCLSLVVSGN